MRRMVRIPVDTALVMFAEWRNVASSDAFSGPDLMFAFEKVAARRASL